MYTSAYEVKICKATGEILNTAASTGDLGVWAPGILPHRILAASVVLNADPAGSGEIVFDVRPTRGGDTNRTDSTAGAITWGTSHTFTDGSEVSVLYEEQTSPVTVYPGQEVVAQCTDADANNTAIVITLLVEPVWARPGQVEDLTSGTSQMYSV